MTPASAPSRSPKETIRTRKAIHAFCRTLAVRLLGTRNIKLSLKLLLEPLNYWRNLEVPVVLNNLQVQHSHRVLDIGSPKIASLFLWRRYNCAVYSTDLYAYFWNEYETYLQRLSNGATPGRFIMQAQDARSLTYPDEYFDRVYSISVLEHIADDGDTLAIREIGRVLKKDGICCITVPYSQRYRETFTTTESYYIKVKDRQPTFYERHYDATALRDRLIAPSRLQLSAIQYFAESVPYERFYDRLPYGLKIALAPFASMATALFIAPVHEDSRRDMMTAVLTFKK